MCALTSSYFYTKSKLQLDSKKCGINLEVFHIDVLLYILNHQQKASPKISSHMMGLMGSSGFRKLEQVGPLETISYKVIPASMPQVKETS